MTRSPDTFTLLETMRLEDGTVVRRDRHLRRLQQAADFFGYEWRAEQIEKELTRAAAAHAAGCWRVRMTLEPGGHVAIVCTPHEDRANTRWRVAFAAGPFDTTSPFVTHKTTARGAYDAARQNRPDLDDVVLWNDRGEVTESTVANVVIERDGRLITPAQACGLLPGVLRAELLDRGEIVEGLVTKHDVTHASRLWLINSLRGWIDAVIE
jgi:para-aminobenzoate synthetase/4-amino-4-deoxychorismate lyase